MIIEAQIISRGNAGEYDKIYSNENAHDSGFWTSVQFTNDDYSEWIGLFSGERKQLVISNRLQKVFVLTSAYLYELDMSGNLLQSIENDRYNNLTVSPDGDVVLTYSYFVAKMGYSVSEIEILDSPVSMDDVKPEGWIGRKLIFSCEEFTNQNRKLEMELDFETSEITIINDSSQS